MKLIYLINKNAPIAKPILKEANDSLIYCSVRNSMDPSHLSPKLFQNSPSTTTGMRLFLLSIISVDHEAAYPLASSKDGGEISRTKVCRTLKNMSVGVPLKNKNTNWFVVSRLHITRKYFLIIFLL